MGKKAQTLKLEPFHVSITKEMARIKPGQKDARAHAVAAARLIATTLCPKDRGHVADVLDRLVARFGGVKSKKWTQADKAVLNHAYRALKRQNAEEAERRELHAQSAVQTTSPLNGRAVSEAPHSNVGVHS